jgi:hypothetical protein
MADACTEDQLVEQPAIGLFALGEIQDLRWTRDLLLPRVLSGQVALASGERAEE